MRLTHSRDGRHASADMLELLSITAGAFAAAPVAFAVTAFLFGLSGSLGSILLIILSVGAVTIRTTLIAINKTIRPRVFDFEQKRHEIVPLYYTEEESPHNV